MLPEPTIAMTRPDELLAELGDRVRELQDSTGTPGAAYGVVVGGAAASAGVGTTSVADPRDVTPSTLFRLCSITKPMTSTLALQLVDDELLALDEPVSTWLPGLELADVATRNALTLRHLLSHTSGLEGEWPGVLPRDLDVYGRNDDALARMIADYPRLAQYAPLGAYWGYCNPGYWLAGHLIETVTGRSYEDALRERIFAPLSMSSASLFPEEVVLRRVALPHTPSDGQQQPVQSFALPRARTSSGGVVASVDDLLRFATASLGHGPQIVSAASSALLREPAVAREGADSYQSLGWKIDGDIVSHGGGYHGYITHLMLIPSADTAVAVLTNSESGYPLCGGIQEWVSERILGQRSTSRPMVDVSSDVLRRYVGHYSHPGAERSEVSVDQGGLRIEITKSPRDVVAGSCVALSETEFTISGGPQDGSTLTFLPDAQGEYTIIRIWSRLGARIPS